MERESSKAYSAELDARLIPLSYIPGWDCHGLPIENKALQELGVGLAFCIQQPDVLTRLSKKDSCSVDPATIRQAANATALREIASQKKQFWSFGVMADWDSNEATYRTLGELSHNTSQIHLKQSIFTN